MKPEIIIAYETPLIIVLHYLEIKKKKQYERLLWENNSTVYDSL